MIGEFLPSPVDEVDDDDELVVIGVRHDDGVVSGVLAHQGDEDVEHVPVDKPLGPPGPGAAAKQGEFGGVVGRIVENCVL